MSDAIGEFEIGFSAIGGGVVTNGPVLQQTAPPQAATVFPTLSPGQFVQRLARLIPHGWAGDDAAQSGVLYSLLLALGTELNYILTQLQYAANAQRLTTETYPELDEASTDFLGTSLPRPSGMSDSAFAQLIIENLFLKAVTRANIQNALVTLTGSVPRMLEPWNIFDTGVWSNTSYWDVDTVANPARYGDGSLTYQGFIETVPPAIAAIGPNNPILCFDDSAYWDIPGYFFGNIGSVGQIDIYSLINSLRAWGTIVWVKFVTATSSQTIVAPSVPTNVTAASTSPTTAVVHWSVPATGTLPFNYQVFYRLVGTVNYTTGPSSQTNLAVVAGLSPGTTYQFTVWASNLAGTSVMSAPVTATTSLVSPGPATSLVATAIGPTSATISFLAPVTGTPPFTYQVLYRVTGTTNFIAFGTASAATTVTVTGLSPNTSYDFEVRTSNVG